MRIQIDYLPDTREARLSTDEKSKVWTAITRACRDKANNALVEPNDKELILPWWAFLLAKEAIGYHVSRHKATVKFSKDAELLLVQALEQKDLYNQAQKSEALTDDQLNEFLEECNFQRTLTKEQFENVKKIGSLPACATFSVPGAGKTTEALAYFCCKKNPETKLFIVCPKNAFAVWEEQVWEIFKDENISVKRLTGGADNIKSILDDPPDVSLITYQQLPFVVSLVADFFLKNEVYLFLDESHRMKRGDGGVIGSAILSLSHLPKAKCIMSGTPLPNSVADLLPQFRFLYPEICAETENVKELIKPVYVRTTKSQLNIPEVTRIATPISLAPAQRELYRLLCSEIARENHSKLTALDRRKLRSLGRSALRLIQLVSNPALMATKVHFEHKELLTAVLEEGDSPKLSYVTYRARELAAQGKKTIIWSSFVNNVELVASRLYDLGADYIHGGVEAGSEEEEYTREAKIKRFHDDDRAFVLVANPAACSEGISLHTVCHHAIYLDRNYNAAQYLQSEDRIHRLGLPENQETTVEIVYSPETIDEAVGERLNAKIQVMAEVLDDEDLRVDPIPFDPDSIGFDQNDALSLIKHVQEEAK